MNDCVHEPLDILSVLQLIKLMGIEAGEHRGHNQKQSYFILSLVFDSIHNFTHLFNFDHENGKLSKMFFSCSGPIISLSDLRGSRIKVQLVLGLNWQQLEAERNVSEVTK